VTDVDELIPVVLDDGVVETPTCVVLDLDELAVVVGIELDPLHAARLAPVATVKIHRQAGPRHFAMLFVLALAQLFLPPAAG